VLTFDPGHAQAYFKFQGFCWPCSDAADAVKQRRVWQMPSPVVIVGGWKEKATDGIAGASSCEVCSLGNPPLKYATSIDLS
jgi:hypothetical protein